MNKERERRNLIFINKSIYLTGDHKSCQKTHIFLCVKLRVGCANIEIKIPDHVRYK